MRKLLLILALIYTGLAQAIPAPPSDDWVIYSQTRKCGAGPIDMPSQFVIDAYEEAHGCAARDENALSSYWLPRCQTDYGRCQFFASQNVPPYQSGTYLGNAQYTTRYFEHIYYYEGPDNKETCAEQGKNYDPYADEGVQCISECAHGSFDGICLKKPEEPQDECTPDSPDYRGELVLGYGKGSSSMCGDYDQCSGDGTGGSVGFFNGELRCISEDYAPPKCKSGTIAVVDDYGFTCETLENQPEEPQTPEEPNTDTDGDGEPDEYQEKNDPESLDKGLDNLADLLGLGNDKTDKSNQHLGKIESVLKSMADDLGSLKTMGENGELAGGGGGSGGNDGGNDGGSGDGGDNGEEQDPPVTWSGNPIDTELSDTDADYDQVMADYQAKITEIKNEVHAMFSTNLTGGGAVVDNTKTIMGVDVNFSLNRFLPGLDILGAIVLFCAAFISAGILFTSRG
jgi:hypothetical protein